MSFRVVIPARLQSSRLPGKVLADLAGQPLLLHVVAAARRSGAEAVWVATDDQSVLDVARAAGVDARLTSAEHPSGSDRIRELADALDWPDETIIVNLQGDEPCLPPALIDTVARCLADDPAVDWATVATPLHEIEAYRDPNVVKVVLDQAGCALYFSRAPIPWEREPVMPGQPPAAPAALRHIGLYAYRAAALRRYCAAAPGALEQCERLEQLRALALGMRIRVAVTDTPPPAGVDTAADLERLRSRLSGAA